MTSAIIRGITVQPTSRIRLPSRVDPTWAGEVRRNLKAANIARALTSTAKNRQVSRTNRNRVSTLPAKLEACSGKNGSGDCTALMCSLLRRTLARIAGRAGAMFTPAENHETDGDAEQRHDTAHADHRQNGGTVAGFRGVILVTKQQKVIDRRPDFPRGRIHESQAHIARRILHTKEVAGNAAVRRQQQDAAGMREDLRLLVEAEAEIGRLR